MTRTMARALAVPVVALALAACGGGGLQVTHVLTGPPLPARADEARVAVYFNEAPNRPYREVAQIRVRATGADATLQQVASAAAEDARELGADAVIVDVRRHYRSVPVRIRCQEPTVDPEWRLNARVTAIVFVPDGAVQPEAPPSGPPPVTEKCE